MSFKPFGFLPMEPLVARYPSKS